MNLFSILDNCFDFFSEYEDIKEKQKELKERLSIEWYNSAKLPRKKKKAKRKQIFLQWQIADYKILK
jgi:hypothetical protein